MIIVKVYTKQGIGCKFVSIKNNNHVVYDHDVLIRLVCRIIIFVKLITCIDFVRRQRNIKNWDANYLSILRIILCVHMIMMYA